jgi:hypothetical protein
MLGVIDQIEEGSVHVELSDSQGVTAQADLPVWIFPCEISEGDMFYVIKENNVFELRCGEPPE